MNYLKIDEIKKLVGAESDEELNIIN